MLKHFALASVLLCALTINAEARHRARPAPACESIFDPCAWQANDRSLSKVKTHRVRDQQFAVGNRPANCPARRWCGCFLANHLGLSDRTLWQARRWAGLGQAAGGPQAGAIVVWRHHVGRIEAVDGNRILVLSGNDGRAVRERWRSTRGVIAYRVL